MPSLTVVLTLPQARVLVTGLKEGRHPVIAYCIESEVVREPVTGVLRRKQDVGVTNGDVIDVGGVDVEAQRWLLPVTATDHW